MKVILYLATSINGYITHDEDDSDWVSDTDWDEFNTLLHESKVIVMGSRTYEYFGEDFPLEGALNVVMTHDSELLAKDESENYLVTPDSPEQVIEKLEEKGFSQLMLIGGMTLATSFVIEELVDEIWLSIHPLLIGQGKPVIEEIDLFQELEFLGSKTIPEGLIQLRYKVKKNGLNQDSATDIPL